MLRIDLEWNGQEQTFRTNNDGSNLFVGASSNNQISCESGFGNLSRAKRWVREYLRNKWEFDFDGKDKPMPKIKYTFTSAEFKKIVRIRG